MHRQIDKIDANIHTHTHTHTHIYIYIIYIYIYIYVLQKYIVVTIPSSGLVADRCGIIWKVLNICYRAIIQHNNK